MTSETATVAEEEYLQILFWLQEAGLPMTGANIARAMQLSAPTVHEMVGRLERDGMVETWRAASNGGPPRKYYSLSPEGERALEAGRTEWQATRDAVDGALGLVKAEVMP